MTKQLGMTVLGVVLGASHAYAETYHVQIIFDPSDYSLTAYHVDSSGIPGLSLDAKPIIAAPGDTVTIDVRDKNRTWRLERWEAVDRYKHRVKGGKNPVDEIRHDHRRFDVNGVLGHSGVSLNCTLEATRAHASISARTASLNSGAFHQRLTAARYVRIAGAAEGLSVDQANRKLSLKGRREEVRESGPTRIKEPRKAVYNIVVKVN